MALRNGVFVGKLGETAVEPFIIISMSTKDLALRIVKDQFGVLAEVKMVRCSEIQEICDFVSNRDHPSFPEILQNARSVFKEGERCEGERFRELTHFA